MNDAKRNKVISLLQTSYNMELETVINYLANSVWLDGIRAKHIKDSYKSRGRSERSATALAWRTVNKQRKTGAKKK